MVASNKKYKKRK